MLEPAEGERLRFVHDKLREVAYGRLEAEPRRGLHRTAAGVLEGAAAGGVSRSLGALARHWEQGGEPDRARPYHLAGARQERDRYVWAEAEAHYRAYLRLTQEITADTIRARIELGCEVLKAQKEWQRALEALSGVPEQAAGLGDAVLEGEALGQLGDLHHKLGQMEPAREMLERALAIHRQTRNRLGEAEALINLGDLFRSLSQNREARAVLEQSHSIALEIGNPLCESRALAILALVRIDEGRFDEARAAIEQSLAVDRRIGDRLFEGRHLGVLAILEVEQGRLAEAQALYEQALSIHREIGNRRTESTTTGNLAILHHRQGRLAEAQALYEQAISINRQIGNPKSEGIMLGNLALVHQLQGRFQEARSLYEQTLSITRRLGNLLVEAAALENLASLELLASGNVQKAAELAQRGASIQAEQGNRLSLAKVTCVQGHIALAANQDGREMLARASALAHEIGAAQESELGEGLAELRAAIETFEAGRHERLFRGRRIEDIPAGQRRWLVEAGHLDRERAGLGGTPP